MGQLPLVPFSFGCSNSRCAILFFYPSFAARSALFHSATTTHKTARFLPFSISQLSFLSIQPVRSICRG